MTLLLDLLPRAILARVQPLPFAVVDGLWRGGPTNGDRREQRHHGYLVFSCWLVISDTLRELPKANQTTLKLQWEQIPGINVCEYWDYVS